MTVTSVDPNDIIGPAGYGDQKFVSTKGTHGYTIDFENAATATAPAQDITITQQLDADLDWRSFRLTGFGFSGDSWALSGRSPFHAGMIDLTATKGYMVEVFAGIDVATGVVTWTFRTIDPTTGKAPTDPLVGMLPIDDASGIGEGWVSYTVQAKSSAKTGDVIDAIAQIVFDTNAPIDTPAIANTLDATGPTSRVTALPTATGDTTFEVAWSGADDGGGSGIAAYSISVSKDGGSPTVWLDRTTRLNALYVGEAGHTYAFSSQAIDGAGNEEVAHATADATIRVGSPAPTGLALATGSDSGRSPTDRVTNVTAPMVTGSAEAGATIALYDGATMVGSGIADASGAWSIGTSPLGEGAHALTATATNGSGFASAASDPLDVTIDTAAPTLVIGSAGGSVESRRQVVSGTIGSADAGSSITIFDGEVALATTVGDGDGHWSASVDLGSDGRHDLTARAGDGAGNVGTSASVTYDVATTTSRTRVLADGSTQTSILRSGILVETNVTGIPGQAWDATHTLYGPRGKPTSQTWTTGGALLRTMTWDADGRITDSHSYLPGTFLGVAYASVDHVYVDGAKTEDNYQDASGNLLAKQTFTGDGGRSVHIDGVLRQVRTMFADGGWETRSLAVTGQKYDTLTSTYGADGKLVEQVATAGGELVFDKTYVAGVLSHQVSTALNGSTFVADYDAAGRVVHTTYADSSVLDTSYAADGKLATTVKSGVTGQKYDTLTSTFGADGKLVEQVATLSGALVFDKTFVAGVLSHQISTALNGSTFVTDYDAAGRVVYTTYADGSVVDTSYAADGKIAARVKSGVTGQKYDTLTSTYGADGKLVGQVATLGGALVFDKTYVAGVLSHQVATALNGSAFVADYDAAGRVASVAHADGRIARYHRNADGAYEVETRGFMSPAYDTTEALFGIDGKVASQVWSKAGVVVHVENWEVDGSVANNTLLTATPSNAAPFGGQSSIDLRAFASATTTLGFTEDASNTFGVLTLTNGNEQLALTLFGQFTASDFALASDGLGGTVLSRQMPPNPLLLG